MPASDNFLLRYLRRLGAGSLLVSVIIHLVALILATLYVVSSVVEKREAKFQGGGGGPSGPPASVAHNVQMSRRQPNLATLNQRLAVDSPDAAVGLPDLPDLPGFSGGGPAAPAGGFGGGPGGGLGFGAGTGQGPAMPAFGFREAGPGGSLVGHLYDFKQLAGPPVQPNADLRRYQPGPLAEKELGAFTQSTGWHADLLRRFFRAPAPLFATQIFVPNIAADEAPRAYGVGDAMQGRAWAALYRGRVSPPESGRYRFVGGADDFMVVRVNGRVVLDAGLFTVSPFKSDLTPARAYPYEFKAPGNNLQKSRRQGFVVGNAMDLRKEQFYDIDILIGEGLGGHFYAFLYVEQEGVDYRKDSRGLPILPIFRVSDTPPPARDAVTPPYQANGPVWRALPVGY